jgi:hypothetical protein
MFYFHGIRIYIMLVNASTTPLQPVSIGVRRCETGRKHKSGNAQFLLQAKIFFVQNTENVTVYDLAVAALA